MNDKTKDPAPSAAPPTVDTTADIEEQKRNAREEWEARRQTHIKNLRNRGYTSGNETRKVRSAAHADFLMRAGESGVQM